MSKIFYDHLIVLGDVDKELRNTTYDENEKAELWKLIDDMVHHRALGFILDKLPRRHHIEFLDMFHKRPHDESLLFGYLREKVGENIEGLLKQELGGLAFELLEEIQKSKK